jgi:hypothetical protein
MAIEMQKASVVIVVLLATGTAFFAYVWASTGYAGSALLLVLGLAGPCVWAFVRRRAARVIRVNGPFLPSSEE